MKIYSVFCILFVIQICHSDISYGFFGSVFRRFFPQKDVEKMKRANAMKDPIIRRKVEEHRATFDGDHIRDFTDTLLKTSLDDKLWKEAGLERVSNDHLEMILSDVFVAGQAIYYFYYPYTSKIYRKYGFGNLIRNFSRKIRGFSSGSR